MNKKRLAIIGSGDLGQLIAHHAPSCGYEVIGFYDDFQAVHTKVKDFIILGRVETIEDDFQKGVFDEIIVGIGYKHLLFKKELIQKLKHQSIPLANVIHPSSYIDPSVKLGLGIFILPDCTLDAGVCLEDGVLLNTKVCIAHDTHIGTCCFIAPAAALAGFIKVGECCFIGINSTLIDNLTITAFTKIGAGAVVTTSISESGLYVGVPARKIK